jgi:hypothetical protein
MGGALALYSAFTYDRPLAGVVALSAYLLQKDAVPGVGLFADIILCCKSNISNLSAESHGQQNYSHFPRSR